VQLTLATLFDAGLDPIAIARLTTAAARALRLPGKGAIAVGSDADLVLVDPHAVWTVSPERLFDRHAASPLSGRTMRGEVVRTWVRGRSVYDRESGVGDAGGGVVLSPARA
jgi:dihydroorotase-like cyclic amidohydrolase